MDLNHGGEQGSANMVRRGGRGGRGRSSTSTRGGHGGFGRGGRGNTFNNNTNFHQGGQGRQGGQGGYTNKRSSTNDSRPTCQVCYKKGHTANECWHRFDEEYAREERHVVAAASSYGIDANWYTDTGATDHITSELEKLSAREKHNGGEQIHTASGAGMAISHVGQSTI